jgi:magnesium transporter
MGDDPQHRRRGTSDPRPGPRAFLFDAEGSDREIGSEEVGDLALTDRQLLWIDADLRDPAAARAIGAALPIREETLERLAEPPGRPRLQDFDGYFHVSVRSLGTSIELERPMEIDCVIGRNWVVTTHREGLDLIDAFLGPIRGETQLGKVEGPIFLAILLDWILSGFFAAIDRVETRLEEFDESLIARGPRHASEEALLRRLIDLRRSVTMLRRTLAAHREVFSVLTQPEFDKISGSESAGRFEVLSDRLEKAIAGAESAREMAMGSLSIVMAKTTERTNDIVKILTVISAALLPAMLIAGVLGMNFPQPFFERAELFWVAVVAMIAMGAAIVGLARRRGWF